jgi:hypothetical protein
MTADRYPFDREATTVYLRRMVAVLFLLAMIGPALAYRPFDGTDAAVAGKGELEAELQPAGVRHEGNENVLIAPAFVLNFGFSKNWEAVLQGQVETPLSTSGPASLAATGFFLKNVLREGVLQDKTGPSIATEFGLLLPGINADSGTGASWAGIVSQRWDWGTTHFNAQTSLTRDQRFDLFFDAIIEGPHKWTVRPVAEFFWEDEFGKFQTVSALVGAIWTVDDHLSFDIGVRKALMDNRNITELRLGFTVGFPGLLNGLLPRK